MRKAYVPPVDTIIARTINETARGDPDALASGIVAAWPRPDTASSRRMEWSQPGRVSAIRRADTGNAAARHPGTAAIGLSRPRSMAETSPTTCPRQSWQPMQRGAGRSTSRSPWAAKSWFPAHIRSPTQLRGQGLRDLRKGTTNANAEVEPLRTTVYWKGSCGRGTGRWRWQGMVRRGAERARRHAPVRPPDRGDRVVAAAGSPRGEGQGCGGGPRVRVAECHSGKRPPRCSRSRRVWLKCYAPRECRHRAA